MQVGFGLPSWTTVYRRAVLWRTVCFDCGPLDLAFPFFAHVPRKRYQPCRLWRLRRPVLASTTTDQSTCGPNAKIPPSASCFDKFLNENCENNRLATSAKEYTNCVCLRWLRPSWHSWIDVDGKLPIMSNLVMQFAIGSDVH